VHVGFKDGAGKACSKVVKPCVIECLLCERYSAISGTYKSLGSCLVRGIFLAMVTNMTLWDCASGHDVSCRAQPAW
jgi:hypothetical protein